MKYIKKKLAIDNVRLVDIAKKFDTPTYCYSYTKLKKNINSFKKNFKTFSPLICFAVKSNTNVNLIREIQKFGLGADVVSMGELMIALKAGINPNLSQINQLGKNEKNLIKKDKNALAFIFKTKVHAIMVFYIYGSKKITFENLCSAINASACNP